MPLLNRAPTAAGWPGKDREPTTNNPHQPQTTTQATAKNAHPGHPAVAPLSQGEGRGEPTDPKNYSRGPKMSAENELGAGHRRGGKGKGKTHNNRQQTPTANRGEGWPAQVLHRCGIAEKRAM